MNENLSPQFITAQQLKNNPLVWPVSRGITNAIYGVNGAGTPDSSTFENYDEINKRLAERGAKPQGIGIHWSHDPEVAKNFALNEHASYDPVDQPRLAGIVYHGYVQPKDVWDYDEPGSVEHHDDHGIYHPDSEEHGGDYGEQEATVKKGKPVHITGTTIYHRRPLYKDPVPLNIDWDTSFRAKA